MNMVQLSIIVECLQQWFSASLSGKKKKKKQLNKCLFAFTCACFVASSTKSCGSRFFLPAFLFN